MNTLPQEQSSKSPAFSFYAKEWLSATLSWALDARGAYATLLAYQWDSGSVPGDDLPALARVLGVSSAKARMVWSVVSGKFERGADGLWRNPRLEQERDKQAERRAALKANGAKGGRPVNQKVIQIETNRFTQTEPNENLNKSLPSSSSFALKEEKNAPPPSRPEFPIIRKRNGNAEYEHPRFDVPISWHRQQADGLANGEARLPVFYRWLADRVDRTNEDTLPRLSWLDKCLADWLASTKVTASSVPSSADTARMIADRMAKAGK